METGDLEKDVKRFRQCFEDAKLKEFDPDLGNRFTTGFSLECCWTFPEGAPASNHPGRAY